jgi:endo-1,4-beta-xylanase
MKFEEIHPERYRYDWTKADQLVSFAETNGMKVRGHTLVWHTQLPNWLTGGNFSTQEVKSILEDHVRTVIRRYKNRIWSWDVVNEAIADGGGYRTNSFWYQKLGQDYIKWAFHWAHEEDPNAILYYNDYGAEGLESKSDSVYNLVRDLRNAGVPVEGVGWQLHETDGWRVSQGNRDNAARLRNLGVELSITEMDLRIQLPTTQAKLDSQAEGYRQAVEFCLSNCAALLTWGFTDKYSWVPSFFSGYGAALPFDSSYQPKPAYYSMQSALGGGSGDVDTSKTYRIISVNSGKALDVCGPSTADGALTQQWDYVGGTNQKWRFESVGGGYYRLRSQYSNKCLDVAGGSTADGALTQQWSCHDGDNQRWRVIKLGSEVVIEAKHSGKVLDVRGVSTANGAKVQPYTRYDTANQRWRLEVVS